MSTSPQIDRNPELRAAIEKALETGAAHVRIAKEHGVSRWAVDRFAKRNGNGEPPKAASSHKPRPVELDGETVARIKSGLLPWTYNLIARFYGVPRKVAFDAHRKYQDKLDEQNGVAERKRRIDLVGEQIAELRGERRKVAHDGTPAEHREITHRVSESEDELERLERAQREHDDREAAARFRTPEERRKEIIAGLADAQKEIYTHRVEAEMLLAAARVSFQKLNAWDGARRAGQHELNSISRSVQNPAAIASAQKFGDFVAEWIQKGERNGR